MKYAIVGSERTEAQPNLRGICPLCAKETISKCGKILMWHWAHKPSRHCDPWWEGETEWHRDWKSYFTPEQQEVIQTDPQSGEIHIADVKTMNGVVIEFQNSPMDLDEMCSRERFYGRMVWIVNGQKFRDQFHPLTRLPPPDSELAQRLVILRPPRFPTDPSHPRYHLTNNPFFLTEKNVKHLDAGDGVQITYYDTGTVVSSEYTKRTGIKTSFPHAEVIEEIDAVYAGHHYLQWTRPRDVWLSATAPVFIDLGGGILFHIQRFKNNHLCVRAHSKRAFLAAHGAATLPPEP
jgi:competence protein CoiA